MNNVKRATKTPRFTESKRDFTCSCGNKVKQGQAMYWDAERREAKCTECAPKKGK